MKIMNMITENDIKKVQIAKIEEVLRDKLKTLIVTNNKYKFYSGDIKIHIDTNTQEIKMQYKHKDPLHFTYDINAISDADLTNIAEQFLQTICKYYSIYSVVSVKKDGTKAIYSTCRYDRNEFDLLTFFGSEEMAEVSNALYSEKDSKNTTEIEIYDENAEKTLCEIKLKEYFLKNRKCLWDE